MSHEDDARRALLAGLGIVEVITTTLNQRLKTEKGVQLTVRLGVHTGPVVVGKMGGGGRHENLATGETVNVTARLEGLARPNTVVLLSGVGNHHTRLGTGRNGTAGGGYRPDASGSDDLAGQVSAVCSYARDRRATAMVS